LTLYNSGTIRANQLKTNLLGKRNHNAPAGL
jgi:hypothetical protein